MKIVHISDLHFGMHDPNLIAPFLQDLADLKPDLIMISGDLTQRATEEQYLMLERFLKRLPAPFLAVPGNHDIPLYNPLARLLYPFEPYKAHINTELEPNFCNDAVTIMGINSVNPYKLKDGRLREKTLLRIKKHFSEASDRINIIFFHHNLNYFSGMHHPLNNADEFLNYLRESQVHMVCTGHLHYATLKLLSKNNEQPCAILHAGSLFCLRRKDGKNSFYVIDTDGMSCSIDWRVFKHHRFWSEKVVEIDFKSDKAHKTHKSGRG